MSPPAPGKGGEDETGPPGALIPSREGFAAQPQPLQREQKDREAHEGLTPGLQSGLSSPNPGQAQEPPGESRYPRGGAPQPAEEEAGAAS